MEKRRLGRTGHNSTVITFGAYSIGKLGQEEADSAIQMCLDYGINHIDIAPGYSESMERVAPWMPELRSKMFLGCKTPMRTRDDAWRNIEDIMQRMNVASFDLFQLHSVIDLETLNVVTGKGGALEALVEMKEQGLAKWLGITGHGPSSPSTHLEALRRFDFDTVMFPVNASMYRNSEYRKKSDALISVCRKNDVGIQTIKMIARGGWSDSVRDCGTWYDPYRDQKEIDESLWWLLSQDIDTAPSCGEFSLLKKVLDAGSRFRRLPVKDQENIVSTRIPINPEPLLAII
ncbi:aldo/keto reductase [Chloroflexi bacterium]|nr:aldo/keto reductase [Chloroflexota bacterium]